jgi:dynein heavy chain
LRETWVNKIKDIIKAKFALAGEGWFNISETNRDAYEIGKLKRFLTMLKF